MANGTDAATAVVTPSALARLRRLRPDVSVAMAVVLATLAGCASSPVAAPVAGPAAKDEAALPHSRKATASLSRRKADSVLAPPTAAATTSGVSFPHTNSALRAEIAKRADAAAEGPIGNHAAELASLRLAASGLDLIDAGSLGGAAETLQRAVSLWGGNGYAYTFLAYVQHAEGRSDRAAESLATAGRYLPRDREVRGEFEALDASIRRSPASTGT